LALACTIALCGCERKVSAGPRPELGKVAEFRKTLSAKTAGDAASGDAAAAAVKAEGWATLTAAVKFVGAAPAAKKISGITPECSAHDLREETVVVGPDGGLANVLLYLTKDPPAVHPDYEATAKTEVELDNTQCRFEPHTLVLRTTQTLLVKNSDDFGHNTKLELEKNPTENFNLPRKAAQPVQLKLEESTPRKYGCSIHPWMGGWLLVRNDPYAAKSDDKGALTLANLPAGVEMEFQLWHEKVQGLKAAKIGGVKIDGKGRFKLKLEAGKDVNLDIQVPAEALR
jgi:hypothetical protein